MFDPTIFENLKVIIEGLVYDFDLDGQIAITDRKDLIDLATMSRHYSIRFHVLGHSQHFYAKINLQAGAEDLFGEILEKQSNELGCQLHLVVGGPLRDYHHQPTLIISKLETLWDKRPKMKQEIFFNWNAPTKYYFKTHLFFNRKINEDHISDFEQIVQLLIKSLLLIEDIDQEMQ